MNKEKYAKKELIFLLGRVKSDKNYECEKDSWLEEVTNRAEKALSTNDIPTAQGCFDQIRTIYRKNPYDSTWRYIETILAKIDNYEQYNREMKLKEHRLYFTICSAIVSGLATIGFSIYDLLNGIVAFATLFCVSVIAGVINKKNM